MLRTLIPLFAVVAGACAPAPSAEDTDGASSTSEAYPSEPVPGAPDEHCALDPARVYVLEADPYDDHYRLTDVLDRSVSCAYDDSWPGQLDPEDGQLVAVKGLGELELRRTALVKFHPDWLREFPYDGPDLPDWTNHDSPDNDEVLFAFDDCTDDVQFFPNVVGSTATLVAGCAGAVPYYGVSDLPFNEGVFGPPIASVDGRRIYAISRGPYAADAVPNATSRDDVVEIAPPEGVNELVHIAARPNDGALMAAAFVVRGDIRTIERARITPDGVTLEGEYVGAFDGLPESVEFFHMYAIAADGTLLGLGDPIGAVDFATRVVAFRLDAPPELVFEMTPFEEYPDWQARLVTVGTGESVRVPMP